MPIICSAVLCLPFCLAEMTSPSLEATLRRPVMENSRASSSTTSQASIRPMGTIQTRVAITRILSASGSRNFPSRLIWLYLRAR